MKLKKCDRGFNCGDSCINKQFKCKQNIKLGAPTLETYAMYLARKSAKTEPTIAEERNKLFEDAFRAEFKPETVKLVEEASAHWASLLATSKLATQVPSQSVIEAILDDRMKSQFETGTSGGVLNADIRKKGELDKLGIPIDAENSTRPVYGYLANEDKTVAEDDYAVLSSYGENRLILKDSLKDRATYTAADSLENGIPGNQAINAKNHIAQLLTGYLELDDYEIKFSYEFDTLDDVEYAINRQFNKALKASTLSEFRRAIDAGINVYTEAQIFGEVRAEHIESVELASPPNAQLAKKLKSAGISYTLTDMFK